MAVYGIESILRLASLLMKWKYTLWIGSFLNLLTVALCLLSEMNVKVEEFVIFLEPHAQGFWFGEINVWKCIWFQCGKHAATISCATKFSYFITDQFHCYLGFQNVEYAEDFFFWKGIVTWAFSRLNGWTTFTISASAIASFELASPDENTVIFSFAYLSKDILSQQSRFLCSTLLLYHVHLNSIVLFRFYSTHHVTTLRCSMQI